MIKTERMLIATSVVKNVPISREIKRQRERRARERRAVNLVNMQHTLAALECAALVARTLGDASAAWEDFLSEDELRMRQHLVRSVKLSNEARVLQLEKVQLLRMVREHQLVVRVMAGMAKERDADDWEWHAQRLSDVARRAFKPWTRDECRAEMETALKQRNAIQWGTDKQTSNLSILGWREYRQVDVVRGACHLHFYKTFEGYDIMESVKIGWDAYTDSKFYLELILGHRVEGFHEVLQRFDDHTVIVRSAQRFPNLTIQVHIVYLVFRIPTECGYAMCVRSICCPELQKAIDSPNDMWASNCLWMEWELVENQARTYRFQIGGTLSGRSVAYSNKWMIDALGVILRTDAVVTRRHFLTSE